MLSGGPKWLIARGFPGRGLKIAIFWISACSVVQRAFLEPSRSASCKSGLPPALPASVGDAKQPGKWPSCPSGRLGKSGPGPPSGRGLPTRRRMLSGGPKWLIVRGSPSTSLKIAIFWVSACSVVRRAFPEPSRSISCKNGLPPALPCLCGRGQTAWQMAFLPVWPARKIWARPPSGKCFVRFGDPKPSGSAELECYMLRMRVWRAFLGQMCLKHTP